MPLDGHPRILITRLSAIGDCILTMPLLCALRHALPQAMIAWAVHPIAVSLLKEHECLDQVIEVPRGWLKSPTQIRQLRRTLKSFDFDISIDAQSLLKSSTAAWISGARHRIGFAPPQGRELSHWFNNRLVRPTASHIVDMQLELLAPLGITPGEVEFRVPAFEAAATRMDAVLEKLQLPMRQFAVINPGAAWPSKRWEIDRFADVAKYLAGRHGRTTLVVWAGAAERAEAEQIVAQSHGAARLAPATSLPELACVLRRATLLIASDTGPLHLSVAVGTTSIGLYGTTLPQHSGPYGSSHLALQAYYQSGSCRERRRAANDAMRAISVQQVCLACTEVLERPHAHAA